MFTSLGIQFYVSKYLDENDLILKPTTNYAIIKLNITA